MIVVPIVRLATAADAAAIAALSRDAIEQGLGWSWTRGRVLRSIRDRATNVAVLHERDALLGFGIMQYGDEKAHLSLLAVQATRRRTGLGTLLLAWLEKSAVTAGIERIQLEARVDNPDAVRFYRSQGYRETGSIAGYYNGTLDAIRLEKSLRDLPA
jgi:[ribosomal protein S18]-alanine N-acetyltransferase